MRDLRYNMYISIIFKEIVRMDLTDRKILNILEENSKTSLSDIS
ncbi:AsnC family transcriptional regulator, partial [Mammaliicoccus sciuri]